ncbi:DUF4931 domain-containing protein [Camelliibacillus cellulosilyticus]|uniref:DUF4931 domain-containing protein n=1 Tax=Camelliibacillus cellulosilyticus TaxID=2174486 RepID=A0ABV9GQ01_9BACL
MAKQTILTFNPLIAKNKPNSIHRNSACPFCKPDELTEVIASDGPIILVKNKYPVLQNTYQTVLIETDQCDSELSEYSASHLKKVIHFGVEKWLDMEASGAFQSVIFFKNHGPLSGGSIRHPHMQIIGLKGIDYRDNLKDDYFVGDEILETDGVSFNLSTKPMIGFTEFNVVIEDLAALDQAAHLIQITVRYILNRLNGGASSYNIFFYEWRGQIAVKIVPRYPTTPLFVGYQIRQVNNQSHQIAEDIRNHYLS